MKIILEIIKQINTKNKKRIIILLIFMLFTAGIEIISIASVLPFLMMLTNGENYVGTININKFYEIFDYLGISRVAIAGLLFLTSVIVGSVVKIKFSFYQQFVSRKIGIEINKKIFANLMMKDYKYFLNNHSADLISGTQKSNAIVSSIIQPVLTIITSATIVSLMIIAALLVQPGAIIAATICLVLIYIIIYKIIKAKLNKNGFIISEEHRISTNILIGSIGGIREIIVDNLNYYQAKKYNASITRMHIAAGENDVYKVVPRHVIEASSMFVIGLVALWLFENEGTSNTIPMLGATILAAQRIIPLFQQIYASTVTIRGWLHHAQDVLKLLETTSKDHTLALPRIQKEIGDKFIKLELRNVYYGYKDNHYVLNDVNLEIYAGEIVGIVGQTGSGKSTLMDLILGLVLPNKGNIYINDVLLCPNNIHEWRSLISHVPQNVFLYDTSIEENICVANSEQKINYESMIESAKLAKIYENIMKMDSQFDAKIGERGVRLSGGQRQRIGIARALYKGTSLLILDEPTSSLDAKIEDEIFKNIMSSNKNYTTVFITHNQKNLIHCNKIFQVSDGKVYLIR